MGQLVQKQLNICDFITLIRLDFDYLFADHCCLACGGLCWLQPGL